MNKKHIFWDLDDTLIITQINYEQVNEETAKFVHNFLALDNLTVENILETMHEFDIQGCIKYGLSIERFPNSWAETLVYYADKHGVKYNDDTIEQVKYCANKIFRLVFSTYDNVHAILSEIKKYGWEMNILTAGNDEIQNKRLHDANLVQYFDNIYVVPTKTPDVMKNILNGREVQNSVMIGNSLRSDIHPALSNGMFAVHVERKTWGYDEYDINFENPRYHRVNQVDELPTVLQRILTS